MNQLSLRSDYSTKYVEKTLVLILCAALFISGKSYAQDTTAIEVEIDRSSAQLSDLLTGTPNPHPDVASFLDTAMIVTSVADGPKIVRCHAKNDNGVIAGRIRMYVPSGGLRFFLASDIVHQRGFVGSVICEAPSLVVGSEIMLGVITSDIEVHQDHRAGSTIMLFPVTAVR